MTIREMRKKLGETQCGFANRYNIPFRTIQNWEAEKRTPPEYIVKLLEKQVEMDLINRRTISLPEYDSKKKNLPSRKDFSGALSWLRAVQDYVDKPIIYALDEALMCQGSFGGRTDEYLVWVYGDDSLSDYNGIVVLGNDISAFCVEERDILRYTNFNRTIIDSLANEPILDMQGITEALAYYYYSNGETFEGILPSPQYQKAFDKLAKDAIEYYCL